MEDDVEKNGDGVIVMVKIQRKDNMKIRVTDKDGGFIESQTVEANILYDCLQTIKTLNDKEVK